MKTVDSIRFLLTLLVLVVLAVFVGWTWFWAFLALAVFGEAWTLGYKFLKRRRS